MGAPGDARPGKIHGFEGLTAETATWHAWRDVMPAGSASLHVIGDVRVSNPGVSAVLTMRCPQGISPATLILDLSLIQQPGMWITAMTTVQTRFDGILPPSGSRYDAVEVYLHDEQLVLIDNIRDVS